MKIGGKTGKYETNNKYENEDFWLLQCEMAMTNVKTFIKSELN